MSQVYCEHGHPTCDKCGPLETAIDRGYGLTADPRQAPTVAPPPNETDQIIEDLYACADRKLDMAQSLIKEAGQLQDICRRLGRTRK